ncbi:MAG: hypothetical protein JXA74_15430 [Anaerolineae bacterium]|nr:hypothetical protein [Anaerolineae bacterium]
MGFLGKIKQWLTGSPAGARPASSGYSDPNGIYFHFRCNQCGEIVRIRVDKRNDLNREDDGPGPLLLRKEVMGNNCFQLMHAEIWLSSDYGIAAADVTGGELVSAEEYEASLAPAAEAPESEGSTSDAESGDTEA